MRLCICREHEGEEELDSEEHTKRDIAKNTGLKTRWSNIVGRKGILKRRNGNGEIKNLY